MKMNSTSPNSPVQKPITSRIGKGLLLILFFFLASSSFAQLQVLEPSLPGISLVSNTSYTVRWARGGTTFNQVDIQYSSDGGATYTTLVIATPSTAADTSEAITIPGIIGGLNKIRVRKRSDNTQSDVSDNNFTITGFCFPLGMSCSVNYMEQVIFNTLNSSSACNTNRAYVNYGKAGARTTTVQIGLTYPFKVRSNKTDTDMGFGIWADWNNDSDFADAGEFLYTSPILDTTFSGNITIPSTIATGDIRFRARCVRGQLLGASDYCTYYNAGGEIEDYTITISRPVILTNTFLPATPCPGATFNVPFSTTGTFQGGNTYTAQLSLPGGSFTSATNIGTGSSSPISVKIPLSTQPGAYYIRVISTNPAVFGQKSNSISVKSRPAAPFTSGATRCGDGSVMLSAIGCSTFSWYDAPTGGSKVGSAATYNTPTLTSLKDYYAECTNPANGCVSLRTVTTADIKPVPTISGFTPTTGIIDYDIITITGNGLGSLDSVKFFNNKRSSPITQSNSSFTAKAAIGSTTGPITVYSGCGTTSSSGNFTPVTPTISAPAPNLVGGTYANAISVTLSTSTTGADIYYTLNGSTPTPGNSSTYIYSGAIFIGTNVTLKAIGYRSGWTTSTVTTDVYSITNKTSAAKPVIDPPGDAYTGAQLITITTTTPQAKIYFTVNGNTPVPGSGTTLLYQGPFTLIQSFVNVKAIAVKEGYVNSAVNSQFYTITGAVVLPACTFSPVPGIYADPQDVFISNTEPDVDIYFTLDGTEPTRYNPGAQLYAGLVPIGTSKTLKARAYKDGFGESAQTIGVYTIGALRRAIDGSGPDYYTDATPYYGQSGNQSEFVDYLNRNSDQSIKIYPNPGTGIFFMDFSKGIENADVQVINMMGQEVLRVKADDTTFGTVLNLTDQRAGFYMVRMKDSKGNLVEKKIVLQ